MPAAYRAMALQLGGTAGIAYRFGAPASSFNLPLPSITLFTPVDHFERCYRTPINDANCATSWQIGGPWNTIDPGLYSTNQGTVTYLADEPTVRPGLADLQFSAFDRNTFQEKPQPLWQIGGEQIDSMALDVYRRSGFLPLGSTDRPVASARCAGPAGMCATTLVAMQSGKLLTTGTYTASNTATAQLAPNKVPTAVALTSNTEFAFVTVWDTELLKGQIAVVALAGLCDKCALAGPYYDWWHEWLGVYPGLPNMGNLAFMKILGYVDLPMQAPTSIAVTTGLHPFNTVLGGGSFMGESNSPLSAHWPSFAAGGDNFGRYAKGGVAVVASRSEKRVAFVDLRPLFDYVNRMYFSTDNPRTQDVGQGAAQWPFGFDTQPQARPVVARTIDLGQKPTAVRTTVTSANATARAWVATEDGQLKIYSLGGYVPGWQPAQPLPGEIAERGTVAIGRNPSHLAGSKGDIARDDTLDTQVIVTARGERMVQWVRFAADGNSGSIVRSLQDSRLVDPIVAEDNDNFANVGFTLSVADHAGKAVRNYRYGPVVFADRGTTFACQPPNGCPVTPTAGVAMEHAGSFDLPGAPFQLNISNVP